VQLFQELQKAFESQIKLIRKEESDKLQESMK
jgi:hypothetical protein